MANSGLKKGRYTQHPNKIGLYNTTKGGFIKNDNDVVLSFPFKDTVLEAGMTKEDIGRDERFLHLELDSKDIDTLMEPKVLTDFKYIDKNGEKHLNVENNIEFFDKNGDLQQNLLIKGNNLLALYTLRHRLAGKIKLIYIDPPYNTGNDGFKYNDTFNHSSWLTFMKNRLEIARELLSKDGSIWINIDDTECHYLKVLCDEIFGRDNFVANVIWKKKYSPQNDAKYFSDMHDHILVYGKNKEELKLNLIPRTEEMNARYSNPDNDPRGRWKSGDFSVKTYSKSYDYPIQLPSGRIVNPPKSRCWRTSKERFLEMVEDNRIWFGKDGNATPSMKRFLSEVKNGTPPQTIWDYSEVSHNQDARKEILELFREEASDFATPKPERLLQRIVHLGSNEGDLILDFFLGSGTTVAVAHKMNRRYVGIEQMDYINDVPLKRLIKVIQGEGGGISKSVSWNGGGSFIYFELKKYNQEYIDLIEAAKSLKELENLYVDMRNNAFLKFWFDRKEFEKDENFRSLDLNDRKKALIEILDENQLYLNYADMDDSRHKVSIDEKTLTNKFYGEN